MLKRDKTKEVYHHLCQLIPGGVNSPARACKSVEQMPMVISHASQDLIYDVDDNSYIDFCGSWGALIHGHAHPTIINAVQKRVLQGTSFGITTAIEGKLAQKIIECIPSIEMIRFVSSGTEATMSAIRLARGFTGRDIVLKFSGNYHGHADFFLVHAGSGLAGLPRSSSAGIPSEIVQSTLSLPYNDLETCKKILHDSKWKDKIAAVIIEPIAGNMGVVSANQPFLKMLREETQKIGALLIFDEVISGFRVGLSGAQGLFKITPDLTCLGKIMGGGFPAAAFGGRRDIMNALAPLGLVYQAGTLSGNPVAMEAGLQALTLLQDNSFYSELERKTDLITNPVRAFLKEIDYPACVQQVGSMFTLFFGRQDVKHFEDAQQLDLKMFGKFFRFMFENGVYLPPSQHEACFVSMAHTDAHLIKTRNLILDFLKGL